jgi:hypothetical protein
VRHDRPERARRQHGDDLGAGAHGERADRAEVGAVHVIGEQEHARTDEPRFHREQVSVATAADVVELADVPLLAMRRLLRPRSTARWVV